MCGNQEIFLAQLAYFFATMIKCLRFILKDFERQNFYEITFTNVKADFDKLIFLIQVKLIC